jgi:hypothetical protein
LLCGVNNEIAARIEMKVQILDDGTEVLVSSEKIQILYFTKDGEDQPTRYGIVLTEEIKRAVANNELSGLNIEKGNN